MHARANPEDLSRIPRERLRLQQPMCRAWVERVMGILAQRLPPSQALAWWTRLHIALKGRSPIWVLPENWRPDCAEACWLEAYASQCDERPGSTE